MKTLAVVTILFLPGSFVAAIFSMPMFNWASENADNIINPHFSIYLAVTVPLTLLTFVGYSLWLLIHKWGRNQQRRGNMRGLDENPLVAEFKTLTCKRNDILSSLY